MSIIRLLFRSINQQSLFNSRFVNTNSSPPKNNGKKYAVFGTGFFVGFAGVASWKWLRSEDKADKVVCAPKFPPHYYLKHCRKSTIEPCDKTEMGMKLHNFKYSHTNEAVGLGCGTIPALQEAQKMTHDAWAIRIIDLLGQEEHGVVKVRHIILLSADDIENDLRFKTAQNIAPHFSDCFWLTGRPGVVTLVWDNLKRDYRIYVYEGCVMVKCEADENGKMIIPVAVKFIADQIDRKMTNIYAEEVVEHFDTDWELWRVNNMFVN